MTVYANNVAGTMAGTIGPSDTALLLQTGQGVLFPNPGSDSYYATLVHITTGAIEIVQVTAKVGDTLTIVRGRDNTSAISFAVGSVVEMRLVAQMLREIDWRAVWNVANGICPLDAGGLVPDAKIPAGITRDTELTAGLATKQNTLGFTPVRQGGGVGQAGNTVYIGWDGSSKTKITVDGFDQGAIATEPWINGRLGAVNGIASLDAGGKVPAGQLPAMNYLPLSGGNLSGSLAILSGGNLQVAAYVLANDFVSTTGYYAGASNVALLGTSSAGTVYLRPNGTGTSTGEATLDSSGVFRAPNVIATSDSRLKDKITDQKVVAGLGDQLVFKRWVWKDTSRVDVGVIAQDVQALAPHHVLESNGTLGVDYGKLALEVALDNSRRIRALEANR